VGVGGVAVRSALYALWLRCLPQSWLDSEALRLELLRDEMCLKPAVLLERVKQVGPVYEKIRALSAELTRREKKRRGL
jgi:hypothetical protein